MFPVIMAGGSGSRLWPLSRGNYPKQFISLCAKESMLQDTLLRVAPFAHKGSLVICNEDTRFLAAEQLRQVPVPSQILLEPVGRNTAPAVALAALYAKEQGGDDAVLLVLAADHVIPKVEPFHRAILQGEALAKAGKLVTFGILPTHGETGYGYIKRGQALSTGSEPSYGVSAFVEKPSQEVANAYLASGDYYWNSGMFMFTAGRYLQELARHRPDILAACEAAFLQKSTDLDFIRVGKEAFSACPDDSIDYAVMEKTADAAVVPLDAGWSDVGGFAALWDIAHKNAEGNVLKGDVLVHSSHNNYAHTEDKLIALVGVDDLVVVNTKDAVLVAHKSQTQQVKNIVQQLKEQNRQEVTFHREVYRPWGKYDSVDSGQRFQVKRITVKPGAKLSVQMHHHRAEHWIVVSGTAKVTINGAERLVTENESVYIPVTAVHALENPGKVELELIEVQSGSYLGEDDIVRFEDRYGRA